MKNIVKDSLCLALASAVVLFATGGTVWALDVEKELKGLESTYCKKISGSNKLRLEKCIADEKKAKKKVEKGSGTTAESQCKKKLGKNLSYEMLDRCIASKERPKVKEKKHIKKVGEGMPSEREKKGKGMRKGSQEGVSKVAPKDWPKSPPKDWPKGPPKERPKR